MQSLLKFSQTLLRFGIVLGSFIHATVVMAEVAYKVDGKAVTTEQLYKENQGQFFEIEKQKYELIKNFAESAYLDAFWEKLAKSQKTTVAKAQATYLEKKVKLKNSEINDALEKFKDHPRLKELSNSARKEQVVEYLKSLKQRDAIDEIISTALRSKKLEVMYPKPEEPVFKLTVLEDDVVKYGPSTKDTKPLGCKNDCVISVIEYSEFQCPFCEKVLPTVRRLMTEYKGKVRWVVRDFPLGFHNRAKPAAVAAHCAKDQSKYWEMYEKLFQNQRSLEDNQLKSYAKAIGLDMNKFNKCFDNPSEKHAIIDRNYESGSKVGVTGTPAFFVNGRRLSGALPYEQFKEIFEEELAKSKDKS